MGDSQGKARRRRKRDKTFPNRENHIVGPQSIKQVDLKQRKPSWLDKGVREVCGMEGTGRR